LGGPSWSTSDQESLNPLLVEPFDTEPFVLEPTAEIADEPELVFGRRVGVSLYGKLSCESVDVTSQRANAQPLLVR
jgi:hypothetical protein